MIDKNEKLERSLTLITDRLETNSLKATTLSNQFLNMIITNEGG